MRGARLIAIPLLTGLLAACGGTTGSGGKDGPVKVGGWVATTGPIATVGVPVAAGTSTYFKELNAAGGINGREVEWKVVDDAYDPQQTIQVARQLVQQDKVVAVVGALGTSGTEATFPLVLDQAKVPIVGPYAGIGTWFKPDKPGLWGMFPLNDDTSAAAADWAVEEGAKKVVIVRSDSNSFKVAAAAAAARVKAGGGTSTEVVAKLGTTDFAPIVAKAKKEKPDAVVVSLTTSELAIYLKEAAQQNLKAPTYGYTSTVSNDLINLAGESAEGYRGISATLPPTSDAPAVRAYREALKKYAPKQEPDFTSLASYGYAKAFAEVLKSIKGDITAESINKAFEGAGNVETGVLPPLSFGKDSHLGVKQIMRVEIANGKWVEKGEFIDTPRS